MNSHSAGRGNLILIPTAAVIAVLPLLLHGPSYGHDFNFHLLNWMEVARQFSHGTLYPHWAYSPAYNAGEPRFVFYPPLSWTIGALIGLVLTHLPRLSAEAAWNAVPIVFTWICLTLSGFSMYRAARAFATETPAVIGAVLYMVNPYMLFTAYERSAYAELLSAAWIPLLLLAVLSPEVKATRIAIPIALLWLTNAPAAVIGCYATVTFVIVRVAFARLRTTPHAGLRFAIPAAAGTLLGLALAAFYLVPAAWERRFVQVSMATIVNMRIDHNFLFERTGTSLDAVTHDQVLCTASWIAVSLLCAAILSLVACRIRKHSDVENSLPTAPLLCGILLIAFLLTGWSNPIWQHTPELTFLQFPWRLLTIVAPVYALALSVAISGIRLSGAIAFGIALCSAAALTFAAYAPFHQVAEPDQTIPSRLHAFLRNEGAEPTDEYTPQTDDNDALTPGPPPYWLASGATAAAPQNSQPGSAPSHFTVAANRPEFLILNLRDYPAWRVSVNGKLDTERDQRDDGLIAFPVSAATSIVEIRYARSFDNIAGDAVSISGLLVLGLLMFREWRRQV
jgi:hypothetical protein